MKPLQKEHETYKAKLAELLANEGRFVLVCGSEIDVFDTYADALRIGYQRFGITPFLVKKIAASEQVSFFTREFVACPT